jgi:hypothetical protein
MKQNEERLAEEHSHLYHEAREADQMLHVSLSLVKMKQNETNETK